MTCVRRSRRPSRARASLTYRGVADFATRSATAHFTAGVVLRLHRPQVRDGVAPRPEPLTHQSLAREPCSTRSTSSGRRRPIRRALRTGWSSWWRSWTTGSSATARRWRCWRRWWPRVPVREDVVIPVLGNPEAAGAVERLRDLLVEVDDYSAAGGLLITPPTPSHLLGFRQWLFSRSSASSGGPSRHRGRTRDRVTPCRPWWWSTARNA